MRLKMRVGVEITMYALEDSYLARVDRFLERINTYENVEIITCNMSTRIFGEYDIVMKLVQQEIKNDFDQGGKVSFVMKVLNDPIDYV